MLVMVGLHPILFPQVKRTEVLTDQDVARAVLKKLLFIEDHVLALIN
jgi:hypothetical protein